MNDKIMWWGYLHENGTAQIKRWWGDHDDYTRDCEGNGFVLRVIKPFEAGSRDEAMMILKERLG